MSVSLIVDIGSSSVGAALVSPSEKAVPKILFSNRLPVISQNSSEKVRSLVAIITVAESVMNTVAAQRLSVNKCHIFFSSPWYASEVKILKTEYDVPKLITHAIVDELAKDAQKKVTEELSSKGEIVEHRIIQTRLNGYSTSNPYNKKAKSLEIAFFASFIEKDVLESIRRVVDKHFHIRHNEISSFSLAAFSAITAILPVEKDFLIVDIRGEVTDLSLITDGTLIKNLSFPLGKSALAQAISASSGQSSSAALSLLNTALRGNSEPTTQADIAKFTEAFKQTWLQAYAKTLQDISGDSSHIPPTIFLLADADTEVFFENILNDAKKDGSLRLLKHINTRSFVEATSVATDPFLALESIFATMI